MVLVKITVLELLQQLVMAATTPLLHQLFWNNEATVTPRFHHSANPLLQGTIIDRDLCRCRSFGRAGLAHIGKGKLPSKLGLRSGNLGILQTQ